MRGRVRLCTEVWSADQSSIGGQKKKEGQAVIKCPRFPKSHNKSLLQKDLKISQYSVNQSLNHQLKRAVGGRMSQVQEK